MVMHKCLQWVDLGGDYMLYQHDCGLGCWTE